MPDLDPNALYLIPLGGTGEIGMNLNVYAHDGKLLIVDCGVMFGRDGPHDQYAIFPDIRWLVPRAQQIVGLLLTHAHQDHLGAVRDVWPALRCPVYATRFCAEMLRDPLREVGLEQTVPIRVIDERARFDIGPFAIERIPMTHSIVEMGAAVIRTAAGTVLHTGDFKLDAHPGTGRRTDIARFEALAAEHVDAVVCDSTNADVAGWTPSEREAAIGLDRVIGAARQRVAVTLFSTNVARVRAIALAAEKHGRSCVLVGRSIERTVRAAIASGYLDDVPPFVAMGEFGYLPRDRVVLLCTGSQGEPLGALAKLAANTHPRVYLERGDTIVFSSRRIPGNELYVEKLERQLAERRIDIVATDEVHVSGHPCRDELTELYRWVRPAAVVPVHGTPPKLEAHAALAEQLGVRAARCFNGDVLRIAPGPPTVIDRVPTGRIKRPE
jgi:ribonuclease J